MFYVKNQAAFFTGKKTDPVGNQHHNAKRFRSRFLWRPEKDVLVIC